MAKKIKLWETGLHDVASVLPGLLKPVQSKMPELRPENGSAGLNNPRGKCETLAVVKRLHRLATRSPMC